MLLKKMVSRRENGTIFWVEIIYIVLYLLNKSPNMAVRNIMYQEAWSGKKP